MKRLFLILVAMLIPTVLVSAEPFRFLYEVGDQFRYYGTSTQHIVINGRLASDELLTYRIAFSVAETNAQGGGRLKGHVVYLREREGSAGAGAIQQEYETDYWVDAQGVYTVPSTQVMPVVRNVPTFPDRTLAVGDTWTGKGEEVHDMRDDYKIPQLLRVPFDVTYEYKGPVQRDGKALHAIQSDYTLYKRTGYRFPNLALYPVLLTGSSHQTHFFNSEKGREEGYQEEYDLNLLLNTGDRYDFSGTGESHLVEARSMDKPAMVDEVKKSLEDRGLGNVEVKAVPRGVSLNLDNIRFPADSSLLVPSEQEKIRLISEILAQYPDRDILVEGHTANVVGGMDPQTLSEARAAAVGNALVAAGARSPDQILYRGWGAQKPLASNATEEGRAKNRRVEITILEN